MDVALSFNHFKYFMEEGQIKWPTISILYRMEFSRIENSGFQECVFSTAKNSMNDNQGQMDYEHLEKRTLLAKNKQLILDGVI